MKYKDLKPLLPTSWNDVTLQQYMNILDTLIANADDIDADEFELQKVDNTFAIISKLIAVPLSELYSIDITDVAKVCTDVSFLDTAPMPGDKPLPNQKKDVDTTYSNMVTYKNLTQDPDNINKNLPLIVESFLNDVKQDDVMKMNMVDVVTCFFFQQKVLTRFLQTTRQSLLWQIAKQRMKELCQRIRLTITRK